MVAVFVTAMITLCEMCKVFINELFELIIDIFRDCSKETFYFFQKRIRSSKIKRSIIFKKRLEEVLEKIKLNKEKKENVHTVYEINVNCFVDKELCVSLKKKSYFVTLKGTDDYKRPNLGYLLITKY